MDSHAQAWPLDLGLWAPTLWWGPFSWDDGPPRFGVAPRVGTPMLRHGTSSWGEGFPRFCVVLPVGVTDSHASAWPLKLG